MTIPDDCDAIKNAMWEEWKQMIEANSKEEYTQHGLAAFRLQNFLAAFCPGDFDRTINDMYEKQKQLKKGSYLQEEYRKSIPEILRNS